MEYFKQEGDEQLSTISLGYGDTYHQLPVMVELKPVGEPLASTVSEDQRVQLFNINPFSQSGQIQYVQTLPQLQYQGKPLQQQQSQQPQGAPEQRNASTQSGYECGICGVIYKNPQSLARHQITHPQMAKTYQCHHCNKMFGNQQALRRHQNKHPDIVYEWKCRFCPLSFPYKTTLSKHVKVHAGEKLFKCESCLKRFGNRYSLLRHAKIHTGEVPYRCEVCDKGFLKASDFGRHVRTHTGERPFRCPSCLKSFTQKSCLVKHCEKKHALNIHETIIIQGHTIL